MAAPPTSHPPPPSNPSLPTHLLPATAPVADPANIIAGDRWRITVLNPGLVRLEWSPSGRFVDRASQTVLFRDTPAVPFTVRETDRGVEVRTERFQLWYDRGPFAGHGLLVQALQTGSSYHSTWRFGMATESNLGGTARTLDEVDGACPVEDGVLAVSGIACYDDSGTVLLGSGPDDPWFVEREPGSFDLYVFCFGRDYRQALQALYRITGPAPLLPRFALGNWWSRYHPYRSAEYLELMDRFAAERLPVSVAVIDMDWHVTAVDPTLGSGWTGYTWNRDLIPDPRALLADLHARGLKVTLNVHPADGLRVHEDCYSEVARRLGVDPPTPVRFDPTDPAFVRAYLEVVHHPLEADGVDFWWVDWQQGRVCAVAGLDPLWLLNHLHFLDSGRPGGPLSGRPMTLSRYAGLGSHRYPVGFSGDTVVSWASLKFQPEFTATAANVGYGWWSHDIGGHMFGVKDSELATRWVQLGVFSPILRLHSTNDPFNSKEPWRFPEPARAVMGRYLRLRHQLLPYLATMVYRAHHEHRPLVEPMYHKYAWQQDAYRVPRQFRFGSSLLVAPVTEPVDRRSRRAQVEVWLPPGDWVDLLTGLAYRGGRMIPMHRPIQTLPVLAAAGTVLPLVPEDAVTNRPDPPRRLQAWVVAGGRGTFDLVEDNDDDAWAFTTLSYRQGEVTIAPVRGVDRTVPADREWSLVLVGFGAISVEVEEADGPRRVPLAAGPVPGSVTASLGVLGRRGVSARIIGDLSLRGPEVADIIFAVLDEAEIEFTVKGRVWDVVRRCAPADAALALRAIGLDEALLGALTEILLARA